MTDLEKFETIKMALRLACKWIRENPPGDLILYWDHPGYMEALVSKNDPDGVAWMATFLKEAEERMKQNA